MPTTSTYAPTSNAPDGRPVDRVAFAWTSDASGTATGATSVGTGTVRTGIVTGTIYKVQFVPGTGGNQPNNGYSVTLTDTAGGDVLAGLGAALSNATPSYVCPGVPLKDGTSTGTAPAVVSDVLALNVSGAGNGKSGTVVLYLR